MKGKEVIFVSASNTFTSHSSLISQVPREADVIILILQMRKLRFREVKHRVWGQLRRWQRPGCTGSRAHALSCTPALLTLV